MNQDNGSIHATWQKRALKHFDALYGFAMVLSQRSTEAEDLVQETYAQAEGHYDQLRASSNVKAWLFTIMRNVWLQQLRHTNAGPEFVALNRDDGDCGLVDTADDPQAMCIRIWERDEIRIALARLPVASRKIITLRDIEGFTYREIADILDCPVGTVMSRLARARARLKRLLRTPDTVALARSNIA